MEIGVKNDEQLIKMATIVQRALQANVATGGDGFTISEEEKAQLLSELNKFDPKSEK